MKDSLKKTIYVGLFLVPFIPFLVSSSFFFPFITTKAFAWRSIVEIVFAAWAILALLDAEYRPKKSPILYSVLGFLVILGIANIFSVDASRSFWSNYERMEGYVTILHLGAFFLVASTMLKEIDWKRWWNTTLAASAIMVIYALFQLLGTVQIHQGGVRVDGTFGNATYLAVYMLIHIFVAGLYMYRNRKDSTLKWTYALLILGQLFILYHTATRGAILGLIGGVFVIALLNVRNKEDKAVRKMSLGILVAVLAVVGGFFLLKDTSFVTSSPVLSRFSTISTEELKSGGRSFVWPMALKAVGEKPIFGWGQENFLYVFQEKYDPQMFNLEPWFDRAHNIFLDWMVAGGVLALLAYLSLYLTFLILVWKKDANFTHFERSVLTGLLAAYFFHNLFVFDHLISYALFFSLLAYLHSRNATVPVWQGNLSPSKVNAIAAPIVIILLLSTLYFVNWKPLLANASLIDALKAMQTPGQLGTAPLYFERAHELSTFGRKEILEQTASNAATYLSANDVPLEERNAFYAFVQTALKTQAEKSVGDTKFLLAAGSLLSITGANQDAITILEQAKINSPKKQQVYFELGSAYVHNTEPAKALEVFRAAYELAPNYQESKVIYLIGAIYAGDRALESELKGEVGEQTFIFDNRIFSAYYENQRLADAISIIERRKILDPENASTYEEYIRQLGN